MRLICPNCDAQYEVPDEVMPHAGRDVQCSNCGNTWFEYHPDHALDAPQDDDDFEEDDFGRTEVDADDEVVMPSGRAPEPPVVTQAQRKSLDPAVTDILREEAHRETQARQGETAGGIESQPELGLDKGSETNGEAAQRAREARDRMARMRGADPDYEDAAEAVATAAAIGSRRDMLPDIEEINSTLRSTSDRASAISDDGDFGAPALAKKRNFRSGFLMIILIAVLMLLVYVYAPAIARNIPQLDPALNGYVGLVDQARQWLDGQIVNILQWLDAKADAG